jgi:tetratricopeptide (TPR) repeat protein
MGERIVKVRIGLVAAMVGLLLAVPASVAVGYKSAKEAVETGRTLLNEGKFDAALAAFNEAVRLAPKDAEGYRWRGLAYRQNRDIDKAIADYTAAIRLAPRDVDAYWYRGCAQRDKGQFDRAIADCTEAIRLKPDHADAYYTRGNAHEWKGELPQAIGDYSKSIRIRPTDAEAYCCRSTAYYRMGDYDRSIADCRQTVRMKPDSAKYCNNLAWLLATCPDERSRNGTEAVANARRACELDGGRAWQYLGTLAAAYAESGDFETARQLQERVVGLADDRNKRECRFRLDLYKQGRAYHEEAKRK